MTQTQDSNSKIVDFSYQRFRTDFQMDLPWNNKLKIQFDIKNALYDAGKAMIVQQNTHLWLLYCAANLLKNQGKAGRIIYQMVKPWQETNENAFRDALCLALYDADKLPTFNDSLLWLVPTWKSHFYDPDTGTNWLGETEPTAVSEGCKFYDASLDAYRAGIAHEAGYNLGLSLHYLTDLTQPMHAANFTWLDSRAFGYHTDFEGYAVKARKNIKAPTRYKPHLSQTETEAYFISVARYTKDRYFSLICKPEWIKNYRDDARSYAVWDQRVGAHMKAIFHDAIQTSAQFLLMWMDATSYF